VGATSLGNYIFSGLQTQNLTAVLVGCVAAAALAIIIDQLIHQLEKSVARRSRKGTLIVLALIVLLAGAGVAPLVSGSLGTNGRTVVIGSKPFTEQYILAEVMSDVVESGGFEPDTRPGMGSIVLFEALAAGDIDCYVDYSGTIWTNVMQRADMLPRALVVREMTRWLDSAHGIVCLGALGFENTYALAVRRETAERYGLESLADLAKVSAELTMGSDYEFYARPEWQALRDKYGLAFEELRTFDPSLMYSAVGQGDVDVISAYSTDGRIVDFNLVTLADPLQALPPYDAVLLLSRAAAIRPGLRPRIETLVGAISDEMMREANRQVDQEGASPDSAASDLLSRSPVSPPNPIQ
jgi:osmoprotectant transport system permease protein